MKSRLLGSLLLICVITLGLAAADRSLAGAIPNGIYFGQTPPGATAEVFAPGVISLDDRYEYSIAISPDLTECAFGLTNDDWNEFTILFTSMDAGSVWSEPDTAQFLGTGDGLSPAYSYDGQSIHFASTRPSYPPANLFISVRDSAGGWMSPRKLKVPVRTIFDEWAPRPTQTDALYFVSYRSGGFGSGDIYRAEPVDPAAGEYTSVTNVGATINSPSIDSTPFVAPDESYMIFESDRAGGFGLHDLYVSYRVGGVWSAPVNLGPDVNTDQIEDGAFVSPDGKYLFFNRRETFVTQTQTDLYWVDANAILNPTSVEPGSGGDSRGPVLEQNVPNPFGWRTEIGYTLPAPGYVTIQILDVTGRRVQSLVDRHQDAGRHSALLPRSRTSGMVSGPYFYRLLVDGEVLQTRRMTLLK